MTEPTTIAAALGGAGAVVSLVVKFLQVNPAVKGIEEGQPQLAASVGALLLLPLGAAAVGLDKDAATILGAAAVGLAGYLAQRGLSLVEGAVIAYAQSKAPPHVMGPPAPTSLP